jgi:hypothetical protein
MSIIKIRTDFGVEDHVIVKFSYDKKWGRIAHWNHKYGPCSMPCKKLNMGVYTLADNVRIKGVEDV